MTDHIDDTLKRWRQTEFDYGEADCLLSIGDYIKETCGINNVDNWRGTYFSQNEALTLVADNGGAHGIIDTTGLEQIDPSDAKRGDVVVIDTLTGKGLEATIGALCTGPGVAARLERGVIEIDRRFVRITHAWKVAAHG
jgi:hypothetical protein